MRLVQQCELVEGALRTVFLPDSDADIGDDDDAEEGVFPLPEGQQENERSAHDAVEEGQRVLANDCAEAAARVVILLVGLVIRDSFGDFGGR